MVHGEESESESLEAWEPEPIVIDDDDVPPTQRLPSSGEAVPLYPDVPLEDPTSLCSAMAYIRESHRVMHERRGLESQFHKAERKRVFLDAVNGIIYERGKSLLLARRKDAAPLQWPGAEWMPRDENEDAAVWALRLREQSVSVVDLLYVLCACIESIDPELRPPMLDDLRAYDARTFHMGRRPVAERVRYDLTRLPLLLHEFMVCNARDAGRLMRHGYEDRRWVGDLITLLCNHTFRSNANGDMQLGQTNPLVEWVDDVRGYGLRARRDYARGEYITLYGGCVLSCDPTDCYETDAERRAHCSAYAEQLRDDQGDVPMVRGKDPVVDAELFWRLSEVGRFANQAERAEDENAEFIIVQPDKAPHALEYAEGHERTVRSVRDADNALMNVPYQPYRMLVENRTMTRVVIMRARMLVPAGTPICVNYGLKFLRVHMPDADVTREYEARFGPGAPQAPPPRRGGRTRKNPRLRMCVGCRAEPVAVNCGHCGKGLYCGQLCADRHWDEHRM